MKANGSRREEKGGKNITEKIRCVPRSGAERKTVGRASRVVGGGGWWRSMRGAGAGRATLARSCPRSAGGGRARSRGGGHTPSGTVARRSSHASPSAATLRAAPPHHLSRRRRPAPRDHTLAFLLRLYMSKVLKSVLPIATARVIPQQIHEPDPTCTPLRVSRELVRGNRALVKLRRHRQ